LEKTILDGAVEPATEVPEFQDSSRETGEILDGLSQNPPKIASKYFYDAKGSALFDEITRLPEYYPTRTERTIMVRHGPAIADALGTGRIIIEPGAGNCEKAGFLSALIQPSHYVAVDISANYLRKAIAEFRRAFPGVKVQAVGADITSDITLPSDLPRARRLVFYPGSSVGNFERPEALQLLHRFRRLLLGADGTLLIGVDLVKDVRVLEAAYDDAAGVTAAFNLNVLDHVNRLIGSNFDTRQWRHRALFNTALSRIEMHLEARAELRVRWPRGERRFARGERIHTENSYKYRVEDFAALLAEAGFPRTRHWTDDRGWFAVILARP
jgi:dimethylhistidine N-methyltransferase